MGLLFAILLLSVYFDIKVKLWQGSISEKKHILYISPKLTCLVGSTIKYSLAPNCKFDVQDIDDLYIYPLIFTHDDI
jgi:hypothetical protein